MRLRLRELTAAGPGAVRVLRLEGPDAGAWLQALTGSAPPRVGAIALRNCAGLDEALVLAREDGAYELHLHGSPWVVDSVLALVPSQAPASAASRQERLLLELGQARSLAAARIVLDQLEGALERECAAACAASLEERQQVLERWRERARIYQHLARPTRILLAGPVNAGKSTLFNALVGEQRALVSPEAGTTRDLVQASAALGAYPCLWIDSAGERDTELALEQLGQARARALRHSVDWVLWIDPRADGAAHAPQGSVWFRSQFASAQPHTLQALEAPIEACARIAERFHAQFRLPREPWRSGEAVPIWPEDLEQAQVALGLSMR